jgi:hypothetical protein
MFAVEEDTLLMAELRVPVRVETEYSTYSTTATIWTEAERLSNDPIGISGGLNQYVFCSDNPVNFRDPFGLCTEIKNALDTMRQHYEDSKNESFFGKFFGSQDIKIVNEDQNVVFQDPGGLISSSSMGNQAVGYTAYRTYGYLGAVAISVAGELGWPDLGSPLSGMQGSFADNALGIAQGMIDQKNGH